jgi:dipeptidyl aminopeptidase/acylaminoacyl peptidase
MTRTMLLHTQQSALCQSENHAHLCRQIPTSAFIVRLRCIFLLAAVCAVPIYAESPGRPAMSEIIRAMASTPEYQEISLSPDHRYVAWVQGTKSSNSLATGSTIFLQEIDSKAAPVPVTAKAGPLTREPPIIENGLAWARDSRSLAFLSDADSAGQMQLYKMDMADHVVRRLTDLKGNLATPQWSPDGKKIALLFTANANRALGPLAAVPAPVGVVDEQIFEQSLFILDIVGQRTTVISAKDRYIYEYDWSPRGDAIVATGAHGSGDNNWYVADLFTIELATQSERSLLKPAMQIASPRWSPDGRSIAFLGGLMSDESIAGGDIYVISSAGGAPRDVTPNLQGSAFSVIWDGSSEILFAEAIAGGSGFGKLNTKTGEVKILWEGPETVRGPRDLAFGLSLAADGKTSAVIRESFNEPPGIWSGRIGQWKRLTPATEDLSRWGKAESVQWMSDAYIVQGWLVPPQHLDPHRKYPMVVWVHGGPAWLTAPSWPAPLDSNRGPFLASQGYFVLFPNPRGSTGFGEQFTQANVKDVGAGPLRDILAGIQKVVATHPVDDDRIGLTGWSYGGYMTMWALTQTSRFRAAVAGAGVSDWLSYYGENGIDEGLIPYFGASVYDAPALYAKSSPINYIKNVHTPTLIVVGDSDVECPAPQSYEYWHALKSMNVRTQLVVYPHEGHEFSDPAHVLDLMQRMVSWFDDNMPRSD